LYDTQFIHVPVSPVYCFEVEVEFDTISAYLKNLPLPLFSKRGGKANLPFGKGGLRGI
jgi:hypothetical protein